MVANVVMTPECSFLLQRLIVLQGFRMGLNIKKKRLWLEKNKKYISDARNHLNVELLPCSQISELRIVSFFIC